MKNTRRKHSDAFKTEVALEAIRERKTLSELAQEYQLAPAQISTWKAEFLSNAQMAFGFKRKKEDALDKQTDDLYNQIGHFLLMRLIVNILIFELYFSFLMILL